MLSDFQLGLLGSAFMVVYASTSPFAGYLVDRVTRKILIPLGLAFWSLICAATGMSQSFESARAFQRGRGTWRVVLFSGLALVPGRLSRQGHPFTRTGDPSDERLPGHRGGAVLAGHLAQGFGWRSPFYVLGLAGYRCMRLVLGFFLVEPLRGQSEEEQAGEARAGPRTTNSSKERPPGTRLWEKITRIMSNSAALMLLCVFIGANFVAAAFLTWLPTFIFRKFSDGRLGLFHHLDRVAPGQSGRSALRRSAGRPGGPAAQGRTHPRAGSWPDSRGPVRVPGGVVHIVLDGGGRALRRGVIQGNL